VEKAKKTFGGYINLKKSETALQDCFRLFQEPETLTEDNTWYCPNCKMFVLPRK
jgi:ubiquitin C-terminal hydrolase